MKNRRAGWGVLGGGVLAVSLLGTCGRDESVTTETVRGELLGDFLESGGQVVMEAEHFSANVPQGGHSWLLQSDANASGAQAMRSDPDNGTAVDTGYVTGSPRLDFRVSFVTTGTYQVWVRGRAGGSAVGTSDSVHAGLDGAAVASADRIASFTASFGWSKSTMDGPVATLVVSSAGVHTINLWMREDGFIADKVLLTTSTSFTPTGTGPVESGREGGTGGTGGGGSGGGGSGGGGRGGGGTGGGGTGGTGGILPYLDPSLPIPTRVADLLGRMTLDEKIGQMTQGEQQTTSTSAVTSLGLGSVLSGADSTLNPPTATAWANLIDGFQNAALATRLHIPIVYGMDAVHGQAKVLGATVFPHNIGLGATRDPALVQQIGAIAAQETRASGVPWTFAPGLMVTRDQRWGRTYEGFGDNPALANSLTTVVTGMQGTNLNLATSVLATAKHYVGDGGAVWGTGSNPGGTPIDRGDAQMSEAALRAIHLAPYTSAITRGVGSVMASFSSFNGTKMHANQFLLTTVLKGELGFSGFVVSDWQAIDQLSGTFADKVRVSVNAGVDMFMLPDSFSQFITTLRDEVNAGRVTQARIDDAVRRILTKKFELGLFERPLADRAGATEIGSAAHRDVARQAVRESLVLLKNDAGFLPLLPTATVCVTGNGADNLRAQMGAWTLGWQQPLTTPTGTSILAGVTQTVGAARVVSSGCQVGIRVVSETLQSYAEWFGDNAGPVHDGSGSCPASGGCVVVILGGRPLDIQGLMTDPSTKAIVMAWYPGSEGLGVAQVLYGTSGANFTGRLPVTWKVDGTDTPVIYCDAAGVDANANGTPDACEDVGAHYSNLASPPASVLFPYGFGLSYGQGPTCTDGVKNGSETDVDCGGSCPSKCANGKLCAINADCQSNNCVAGTCQAVANVPPTVSITAPVNGASVVAGSTITISANAADSDGTVTSVTFLAGATQVGQDTTSPYGISWAVPAGPASYSLTARAADNGGATTTSVAVGITATASCTDTVKNGNETDVDCGGSCTSKCANGRACAVNADCQSGSCVAGICRAPNVPPTVSITAPINGASVVAGSTITVAANAADSDGTVTSVTFFAGATQIGQDTTSPYSASWAVPVAAASYSLTARAADNAGATTTSTAVGITATTTCSDGVQNGTETGVDCGGSCPACAATNPCAGLCTTPIVFAGPSFSSGNLGTAATCHQTVANLAGGNCGNFAAGRTFRVNDTLMTCTGNWPSLPAKRNGGYCFQATAGDFAWAFFTTW
jgi:beta-glucosidase-like glycosyl hydrolase